MNVAPRAGVEPATRGASDRRSTTELPRHTRARIERAWSDLQSDASTTRPPREIHLCFRRERGRERPRSHSKVSYAWPLAWRERPKSRNLIFAMGPSG